MLLCGILELPRGPGPALDRAAQGGRQDSLGTASQGPARTWVGPHLLSSKARSTPYPLKGSVDEAMVDGALPPLSPVAKGNQVR